MAPTLPYQASSEVPPRDPVKPPPTPTSTGTLGRRTVHDSPLARHPRQHRRRARSIPYSIPLSAIRSFYSAEPIQVLQRDGLNGPVTYPSQAMHLPASLTRTPIILAAIAIGLVTLVTGLRFLIRSRKKPMLKRLVLNPKQAEGKLRWAIVSLKPGSKGGEKHTNHKEVQDWDAISRIKSLLSQLSDSSLDGYLNEKYPRRPPAAHVHREVLVRRHSLSIKRSQGSNSAHISSPLRLSATAPDPTLYTIPEGDEEKRDCRLSRSMAQTFEFSQSVSMDLADAAGIANALLQASSNSLASRKSQSLDGEAAPDGSTASLSPSSKPGPQPPTMPEAGDLRSIHSSLKLPASQSGCSSVASIEVSDSDAFIVRRAQSMRMTFQQGTSTIVPEHPVPERLGTLPSVVVTHPAEAEARTPLRDSLPISAASSGITVALDDFPAPPSVQATRDTTALLPGGNIQLEDISTEVTAVAVVKGTRVVLSDAWNFANSE